MALMVEQAVLETVDVRVLQGEAVPDFHKFAQPLIEKMIRASGTSAYKWHVFLRDCHRYVGRVPRPRHDLFRVGANNNSTGQIQFKVSPRDSIFCYEVAIATWRKDNWAETVRSVTSGAAAVTGEALERSIRNPQPASSQQQPQPEEPPVISAEAAKPLSGSLEQLTALRDNLNSVINLAADARAAEDIRKEIVARHAAAKLEAEPLVEARRQAAIIARAAHTEVTTLDGRVRGLRDQLHAAEKSLAHASLTRDERDEEWRAAERAAEAPERQLQSIEAELKHFDELEAERAKTMRETPGIAALLAALGQFGQQMK